MCPLPLPIGYRILEAQMDLVKSDTGEGHLDGGSQVIRNGNEDDFEDSGQTAVDMSVWAREVGGR
jgi:hypothetical protein